MKGAQAVSRAICTSLSSAARISHPYWWRGVLGSAGLGSMSITQRRSPADGAIGRVMAVEPRTGLPWSSTRPP